MTTATKSKPTTAAQQLERLEAQRSEAHAAVHAARRTRDAWDQETEQLRGELTVRQSTHPEEFRGSTKIAREGTKAGELRAALLERLNGRNPELDTFEEARDAFHEIDALVSDFKNKHVHDRIREVVSDREDDSAARKNLAALQEWVSGELALAEKVRQVVVEDTPCLTRQSSPTLSFDPRLAEWETLLVGMQKALEEGIVPPGLTPFATDRVANLG